MKKKINLFFIMGAVVTSIGISNVNAEENLITNPNIIKMYQYNQSSGDANYCITGEETTCKEITNPDNITSGTIIKYKVNDTDIVTFHAMYHDETTITMQSQENTVNNIQWITNEDYALANTDGFVCHLGACNNKGPITALTALENATNSWINVKDQTYTMGTTSFKTNAYTGCNTGSDHILTCSTNTYTLPEKTAKARMITVQEAASFGCISSEKSCPIWIYNYLYQSTSYGGTGTGDYNQGYWTMNTASDSDINSMIALFTGGVGSNLSAQSQYGARAVVVIDKYTLDNASTKSEIEDNNQVVQVEDTAWNVSKIGISIGLAVLVLGIMVLVQTYLKSKKEQ